MNLLNVYGLFFMIVIMIPNIVFAVRCKEGFENLWENRTLEVLEQIGRFGCFALMIFIIPGIPFGFSSDEAFALYLIGDGILVFLYCLIWIFCFRNNSVFRALSLSILPAVLCRFRGIMSRYVPLSVAALMFAPCHIMISYKNAKLAQSEDE